MTFVVCLKVSEKCMIENSAIGIVFDSGSKGTLHNFLNGFISGHSLIKKNTIRL